MPDSWIQCFGHGWLWTSAIPAIHWYHCHLCNQVINLHKVIVQQMQYWIMCYKVVLYINFVLFLLVLDSVNSLVTEAQLKVSGFWASSHTSTQQTPVLICFAVRGCHEEKWQENLWVIVFKLMICMVKFYSRPEISVLFLNFSSKEEFLNSIFHVPLHTSTLHFHMELLPCYLVKALLFQYTNSPLPNLTNMRHETSQKMSWTNKEEGKLVAWMLIEPLTTMKCEIKIACHAMIGVEWGDFSQ